ncbi:hypothetical protein NDU88_008950 [Pleurodeles waltl]|uniref:Uncharacterized protein n=1 Tax=Pleurodeles waltl TaxID=8319 RepID=A0AAV7RUR2_PLEWA|nr:hypothetical protein NDU88_008950 [Pleurodeles waltl]
MWGVDRGAAGSPAPTHQDKHSRLAVKGPAALETLFGGPGMVMAEKRSQRDELLEALMLRMDAMDQAIASLKAQTSSSGAKAPSSEAIPPSSEEGAGTEEG